LIRIETDKKTAKTKHNGTSHSPSTLSIYMDGSGIDGHIGAADVSPQVSGIMHQYLGSDEEYNIYAAEIAEFELAADIALSSPTSYTKCIIYIDSQAAILGLNTHGKQSG